MHVQIDFDLDVLKDEILKFDEVSSIICLGDVAPLNWEQDSTVKKQNKRRKIDHDKESIVIKKICRTYD